MNESNSTKSLKEETVSITPQNSISNPEAQIELLKLINQSQRLESLTKDSKISSLEKEICRKKKEIILLKKNFNKLCKLLFQLLRKTNPDPGLLEAISSGNAQIFNENAFSEIENGITEKKEAEIQCNKVKNDDFETNSEVNKITSSVNAVISEENAVRINGNPVTSSANEVTLSANEITLSCNPVTLSANPVISSVNPVISSVNPVTSSGNEVTFHGKKSISKTEIPEEISPQIDLKRITQIVIHKNNPHSNYIEDGDHLLRPLKHEKYTANILLKGINQCYKLKPLDDKANQVFALKLYLELKKILGSKHRVTGYFLRLTNILLFLYENNRLTPGILHQVFGYGIRIFRNSTSILKQMQWIEPNNLRKSDAYYFTEQGRKFFESVLLQNTEK